MVTAKQLATVTAMSDADAAAIAYLEAASGDADQALRWAVQDLLRTEGDLHAVRVAVSHGFVRAGRGFGGDALAAGLATSGGRAESSQGR